MIAQERRMQGPASDPGLPCRRFAGQVPPTSNSEPSMSILSTASWVCFSLCITESRLSKGPMLPLGLPMQSLWKKWRSGSTIRMRDTVQSKVCTCSPDGKVFRWLLVGRLAWAPRSRSWFLLPACKHFAAASLGLTGPERPATTDKR